MIKILAWVVLVMIGILFVVEPFLIGKLRPKKSETYTVSDWVSTWATVAVFLPLLGRVLGWW